MFFCTTLVVKIDQADQAGRRLNEMGYKSSPFLVNAVHPQPLNLFRSFLRQNRNVYRDVVV